MNIQRIILGVALVAGISMSQAMAEMSASEHQAAMVEVGNTICPVSGEKVGEMGEVVKVESNGKKYNLCCSMCKKDFMKNQEKFSKIAEDNAAVK